MLAQADKITSLTSAAKVEVEPIWASLLAKALDGKDVKALLSNIGAGGGAAPAAGGAPAAAAGGAGAAAEEKPEEKAEEAKEESDDDMVCRSVCSVQNEWEKGGNESRLNNIR